VAARRRKSPCLFVYTVVLLLILDRKEEVGIFFILFVEYIKRW
jgi:hypothetical protein